MSQKIALNAPAPTFSLKDYNGKWINLSDFKDKKWIFLVFNRGFA
jgi:peroxiredoxin